MQAVEYREPVERAIVAIEIDEIDIFNAATKDCSTQQRSKTPRRTFWSVSVLNGSEASLCTQRPRLVY